ncbi:hypothetical protein DENIS_1177 [Desulfonema ishimotonii]|uniref:Uncharacterized protein n=1 Tax=Desulfonema ishimotonii TaxID=45657 RepID=A0A401FTD9_9BACT|nr:hypothetical protein DENIS_1177 [Desulfonema ishimotonii]
MELYQEPARPRADVQQTASGAAGQDVIGHPVVMALKYPRFTDGIIKNVPGKGMPSEWMVLSNFRMGDSILIPASL